MAEKTTMNFPAVYELTTKNTFEVNKEEDWLKIAKIRIQGENQNRIVERGDFLSVLPPIDANCSEGFEEIENGCNLGLEEIKTIGKVAGEV